MPARIGPKTPQRIYLREWREAADLTQTELGLRISPPVDKGTVSRWENSRPGLLHLGVIEAFAEALGRKPGDMYLHPDHGPSLDAIAGDLEPDLREKAVDLIATLAKKRAS